jgi:hypothetical protein
LKFQCLSGNRAFVVVGQKGPSTVVYVYRGDILFETNDRNAAVIDFGAGIVDV